MYINSWSFSNDFLNHILHYNFWNKQPGQINKLLYILGVSCGAPGSIANGYKSGGYLYQDTVTYRCYDGYTKSAGDYILFCQADGTWSGTKPTCSSK